MSAKPLCHVSSKRSCSCLRIAVVAIAILGLFSTGSVAFSAGWGSTRQCEFSLLLQKSPYREEFVARVATAVANYWAANTDQATASDATDDSFSLFSIIRSSGTAPQQGTIDTFSKECLSCHDGVRASDVSVDYRSRPEFLGGGRFSGKDHPIGMEYASYVAFGRGYKPIGMNLKMVLVNGRVGCLTCHDPLNPERRHLVMSDRGSGLCLSCHDR